MTFDEVADFLRIHRTTLFRLIREGEIPFSKITIGRERRFSRDEIEKWIAERERQTHSNQGTSLFKRRHSRPVKRRQYRRS
ncbi:MAG: helix-turn-helix domain-containing protein [Candidatus Binataceae bacterium]